MASETESAIRCWNQLIDDILADRIDRLEFWGPELYQYNLDDPVVLRQQTMNLVEAVAATAPPGLRIVSFGHVIFQALDPVVDQPILFSMVAKLPGVRSVYFGGVDGSSRVSCINTTALLDCLAPVRKGIRSFRIQGIKLSTAEEVTKLAGILSGQTGSLRDVRLSDLECPTDESATGLLDPLVQELSKCKSLDDLKIRTSSFVNGKLRENTPSDAPLISVRTIKTLLVNPQFDKSWKLVALAGVGLQDGHILSIVDQMLTKPGVVLHLDLCENPALTRDGYETLSLVACQGSSAHTTIKVSDSTWAAKFDSKAAAQRRDSLQSACSYGSATSDETANDDNDPLGGSETGW
jgi:hypothetical protein